MAGLDKIPIDRHRVVEAKSTFMFPTVRNTGPHHSGAVCPGQGKACLCEVEKFLHSSKFSYSRFRSVVGAMAMALKQTPPTMGAACRS